MELVKEISPDILNNLFENFNSAILVWQLEDVNDSNSFKLMYSNKATDIVTGINMSDFVGTFMKDSFPALFNTKIPTSYYQVIKSQSSCYLGEITYGDERIKEQLFDVKAFPLSYNSVGVVFDNITTQKAIKNELKENKLKCLNLFEGSNDGIIVYNFNQKVKDVNHEIEKLLGYQKDEVLTLSKHSLFKKSENNLSKLEKAFQTVKKEGKVKFKIKFLTKDGLKIPTKVTMHKFQSNGKPMVQCFVRDISERKKSKKAIKENQLRFKILFSLSPNGIIIFKKDGQIVESNNQLNKIFGYEKNELINQNIDILLPKYLQDHIHKRTLFNELQQLYGSGKHEENLNIHGIRKDGKTIPINLKLNPTILNNKKVTMASVVDLSFIKKRELELENSNYELEQFSYMATHDLKIPIANIKSHLEILKKECTSDNPFIKSSIDWIDNSIQQANRTINTISNVNKTREHIGRNIKHVNFKEVLEEIKINMQSLIAMQNVNIDYDFSECGGLYYSHTDFFSILQNLISNAIKYRSDIRDPEIFLKSKITKKFCILYVSDNGLGIDLENNEKYIFKMFKRFHDHIEGTGIGLYMVRKIIEHNGGKITVESEVNKGTTFKIFFKIDDFK